jgi:hypothetical protein
VLILAGGAFLIARSRTEAAQEAEQAQLRRILDTIPKAAAPSISDLVLELRSSATRSSGRFTAWSVWGLRRVHQLGGRRAVFRPGLQPAVAREVQALWRAAQACREGVITCPYCGTEYFLS